MLSTGYKNLPSADILTIIGGGGKDRMTSFIPLSHHDPGQTEKAVQRMVEWYIFQLLLGEYLRTKSFGKFQRAISW